MGTPTLVISTQWLAGSSPTGPWASTKGVPSHALNKSIGINHKYPPPRTQTFAHITAYTTGYTILHHSRLGSSHIPGIGTFPGPCDGAIHVHVHYSTEARGGPCTHLQNMPYMHSSRAYMMLTTTPPGAWGHQPLGAPFHTPRRSCVARCSTIFGWT